MSVTSHNYRGLSTALIIGFTLLISSSLFAWNLKPAPSGATARSTSLEELASNGPHNEIFLERSGQTFLSLSSVPPGTFTMGCNDWNPHLEGPSHQVSLLQPFFLGTSEVTQAQFLEIMGYNPSEFQDDLLKPVHNVSWYEAIQFCNSLSDALGKTRYYGKSPEGFLERNPAANGFRLPTEAEWEFACRAGTTTDHFWGKATSPNEMFIGEDLSASMAMFLNENLELAKSGKIKIRPGIPEEGAEYCWDRESLEYAPPPSLSNYKYYNCGPRRVKTKKPNQWGFYDMLGNVWEWTDDCVHPHKDLRYLSDKPRVNPHLTHEFKASWDEMEGFFSARYLPESNITFGKEGTDGVNPESAAIIRGGAWNDDRFSCRCAQRADVLLSGGKATSSSGFRILLNIPAK